MKFSATDWSFYSKAKDPELFYSQMKETGYDAVEMVPQKRWEQAANAGLEMINLSGPGMEQGLNRLENHAELIAELRDCIALAGENRIPHVIVFSGNRMGQDDATGIKNFRTALEDILPDAEKAGVTLIFEMLNSFDHKDYQADSGSYGFELAKQLNHPSFKLIYDIFHMARMNCPIVEDITGNLEFIGHIHLAEAPARGIPLADGNIKYSEIVPQVIAAGYDKYWGMEFIPEQDSITELALAIKTFSSL